MGKFANDTILLVTSEFELPASEYVWGTGGWLPAKKREALDWLILSRFLGWNVSVISHTNLEFRPYLFEGNRCILIACDPDCLEEKEVAILAFRVQTEPILLVARAASANRAFAQLAGTTRRPERIVGRSLRWIGPGQKRHWRCRTELEAGYLEISEKSSIWSTLNGAPLVIARRVGRGTVATLNFHPSEARDKDGSATALLKHLLIWGPAAPVAWLDLERTFVLRMDDPGSAESVYNRRYSYPKLGGAEWADISDDLKTRNARMSIGYVAGWVDDGDSERGGLRIDGVAPLRKPGQVYPSPLVNYKSLRDNEAGIVFDYEAEFRGIQALRIAGKGDVELHGHTHIHPNGVSWAKASDRYDSLSWYRELGHAATSNIATRLLSDHPLALGIASFRKYFNIKPTTLICPGDEWTNEILECALNLGLHLVSSYYLALRDQERFCWAQHVCAPYLDKPDPAWFDAGLPVVGYFHDYDLALKGVDWMNKWLNRWQSAGVKRFIDFRELAAAVRRKYSLEEHDREVCLKVRGERAPRLVRPLEVMIRVSEGKMPSQVSVSVDNKDLLLKVYPFEHSVGRVILPTSV